MTNTRNPNTDPAEPEVYEIRIKGHLGCQWSDWFNGLKITLEATGETLLTGTLADQAALHGVLKKVRDLGMPLVAVNRLHANDDSPGSSEAQSKLGGKK
jgi:hypothetical protein